MRTREILTIQLGHYANFVGTHWWNIQETNFSYDPENPSEINHDVLYREGEYQKKTTYTPRLLLADLKGTLGYLSEEGNLSEISKDQEEEKPEILWEENKVEKTVQPTASKSPFIQSLEQPDKNITYKLDSESKQWVDYLVPRFHPRTVNVVTEYEHKSESHPFDVFPCGQNLWKTSQFEDEFTDKIRAYVEECDSMQGFQVILDADNGFGGLGTSCIQHLRDEYGKSTIVWPVLNAAPRDPSVSDYVKVMNTVLCWQQLGEFSSLFSPLCCGTSGWLTPGTPRPLENITYKPNLMYHTSGLLATALDTLTLRYRHKKYPASSMSDLCADLNKFGRRAAATSLGLPFPLGSDQDLIDMLDDLDGSIPLTTMTPNCDVEMDNSMHSLSLKGIPASRMKRPLPEAQEQISKVAYRCSSVHEMMTLYMDCATRYSVTYLTTTEQPLKIKDPFPKVFNPNVQVDGYISKKLRTEDVSSIPVMAGLHSGRFMGDMYESLYNQVKKVKSFNKFHAFKDAGLEQDEFEESVNNLLDCKENYEDHDY